MNDTCPDCGEAIHAKAARCACGWKRPLARDVAAPVQRNCEWTEAGIRCGCPGTLTTNRGDGGPWYCSKHFFIRLGKRSKDREPGLRAVAQLYQLLGKP